MGELLSQRAYALRRGVARSSVQHAIKTGRIVPNAAGLIDADEADRTWADRTDLSKPRNSVNGVSQKPAAKANGAAAEARANASAIKETFAAKLAELEYRQKTGELVPASEVKTAAYQAARRARELLQAIPARISAILAGETDPMKCEEILNGEIERVCDELSGAAR